MISHPHETSTMKRRPMRRSLPVIINPLTSTAAAVSPWPTPRGQQETRRRAWTNAHQEDDVSNILVVPSNTLGKSRPGLSKSLDHLPLISEANRYISLKRNSKRSQQIVDKKNVKKTFLPQLSVTTYRSQDKSFSLHHTSQLGKEAEHSARMSHLHVPSTTATTAASTTTSAKEEPIPEMYLLPPLPSGSLTYQTALRDFRFPASHDFCSSSGEDSGTDEMDGGRSAKRSKKSRRHSNVLWSGPIVEYKGQHIFLSTLNCLQVTIGRYGSKQWRG